jgi:hypothetical protein
MSEFNRVQIELSPSDSASRLIVDGWFNECEALWPGQRFSLKVDEVLLNGRSQFQVSKNPYILRNKS